MKPFPFAIWPNTKKSLAEDLRPLTDHLNSGPERVAHDNWESVKVSQHLAGMQDGNKKNEQTTVSDRKCAEIAFRHRLKNLHGVDISTPGLLQVPDSASKDMGTLSSLARIGGVKLASREHENDASYADSDAYVHGTRSKPYLDSGVSDPLFFAGQAGNSFGPALYTENVTGDRFPARSSEARLYDKYGGALAFRMHRRARAVDYETYRFSKQEQKQLYEYLRETMPTYGEYAKNNDDSAYKKIRSLHHLTTAVGTNGLIHNLALAAIGIDVVKNDEGYQGRTVILPHAVHNMKRVGSFPKVPDDPVLETFRRFDSSNPPSFLDHPSLFSYVGPNMFPELAVRGVQSPAHNGNSVLEHTELGMRALDTTDLYERYANLLKMAFFLHDVGMTKEGIKNKNYREIAVDAATPYLDAQQKNAFQLTDKERKLVEHLIQWHGVFGGVLAKLPPPSRDRWAPKRQDTVTDLMTDHPTLRNIFADPDVTNLLGRMWEADVKATPGFLRNDGSNVFSARHRGNFDGSSPLERANARTTSNQRELLEKLLEETFLQRQHLYPKRSLI